MERHFTLPVSIAAALHLGILFGVQRSHSLGRDDGVRIPTPPSTLIPFELAPEPENRADNATSEKTPRGDVRPESPEPPPPVLRPEFPVDSPIDPRQFPVNPGLTHIIGPPGSEFGGPDGRTGAPPVIRGDQLDHSPRARAQVSPQYPIDAKQRGLTGEVLVDFIVDETGAVHSAQVVRSTDRVFDEAALRAVSRWKFEPGRHNGRLVRFHMAVPIVFNLNPD